jgi:hypothetical protein
MKQPGHAMFAAGIRNTVSGYVRYLFDEKLHAKDGIASESRFSQLSRASSHMRPGHVRDTEYVLPSTTEVRNVSTLSGKDKHTQETGRHSQHHHWSELPLTRRYCSDIIDTEKAKPKGGHTPILDGKEMASCGLDLALAPKTCEARGIYD